MHRSTYLALTEELEQRGDSMHRLAYLALTEEL